MPQLLLRFGFGACIAAVASLTGVLVGQRFGGLFLAFPAILPAALTLVQQKEGEEKADVDALGAILGGLAMIAFAAVVRLWSERAGAPLAEAGGWIVWLTFALGLFLIVRGMLTGKKSSAIRPQLSTWPSKPPHKGDLTRRRRIAQ